MARTEYDPEGETAYQDVVKQSSKPSAPISDAMPTASFGGRSTVEVNNPDLGPSDDEIQSRLKGFEQMKKRNR